MNFCWLIVDITCGNSVLAEWFCHAAVGTEFEGFGVWCKLEFAIAFICFIGGVEVNVFEIFFIERGPFIFNEFVHVVFLVLCDFFDVGRGVGRSDLYFGGAS